MMEVVFYINRSQLAFKTSYHQLIKILFLDCLLNNSWVRKEIIQLLERKLNEEFVIPYCHPLMSLRMTLAVVGPENTSVKA